MMTKKDKKNHWDFLTQLLGSEETPDTLGNAPEVCEEGDIQEKTEEILTMEEFSSCKEVSEEQNVPREPLVEEIFGGAGTFVTTELATEEEDSTEEAEEMDFSQPSLVVEEIEEEGYVFKKIPTVQRPQGGFGAGLLEELFPEETWEETKPEEKTPVMEREKEELPEELELPIPVDALDPWAMLAMDLGLPVTLPPEKSEKKTPEKKSKPVQEVVESLTQKMEKEDLGMEKNGWQQETSKSRGKKSSRKEKEVEEMELPKTSAAKPRERRRKERTGREVPEKVASGEEKRKGKKSRIRETYSEEVDYPTDIPGYESEEAMRRMRELFPTPIMDTDEEEEIPEEEERYPNAARSRRRRRSRREHDEVLTESVTEFPEEEVEVTRPVRSRKRKERSWETQPHHDELPMEEEDWAEYSEEDEEEEVVPAPKRRRNRRDSRRAYEREERITPSDDDSYEEEDHVFEEIEEPIDEEEDDEEEVNFATLNVPGWRDTINIIVNTNLSARNREPSSMAGNVKAKRRPKRRS
ncbi:MAG: hypothetical protein Q4D62_10870 [Planctomycetia bacterium]|nr:hypothetical protein [Planctomycetia bacterium]